MADMWEAYFNIIKSAQDALKPFAPEKCDACGAFDEDEQGKCSYCRQPKRQAPPVPASVTVEQDVREYHAWGGQVVSITDGPYSVTYNSDGEWL